MAFRIFTVGIGTFFLSLALGCGGTGPAGTVSGTVTRDGQPVAAQVAFMSETHTASGTSDASTGAYRLMSGESESVPVGTYKVAVTPVASAVDPEGADYAAIMEGGDASAPASPIPQKYQGFTTSGLEFTVSEGDNTFDIQLD